MQIKDGIILLEGCLYLRCRVSEAGVSLRFGMFQVGKRLVHPDKKVNLDILFAEKVRGPR